MGTWGHEITEGMMCAKETWFGCVFWGSVGPGWARAGALNGFAAQKHGSLWAEAGLGTFSGWGLTAVRLQEGLSWGSQRGWRGGDVLRMIWR